MSDHLRERRVVSLAIIMSSAAVAQAFGRFTWGVVLPNARDDVLDGSNTLAGMFGSINVFAYLMGTILVAWLSSRLTLVWLMRVGLMMSTTGLALASFAPAPWVLGVSLFIMGLGGAVIWVPAPGIAARYFPATRRGLASGIVGSGIGVGIVFAGRLAGWVDDGTDDAWQRVYRVELVLAVIVLILVFAALKSRGERPSVAGGFGGFGALRTVAAWKPMTLAYTAYGFSYILIISFLVARLEDDSGFTEGRSALVFSVVGLAIIAGGLTIVPLSDRLGRRNTLVVAFLSWAAASLLILTGNTVAVFIAAVMIGLMFSGIPGTIIAHIVSHTDETSYGPAFSAMTLAFGLAQAISPQIGGAIADWQGSFTAVFVLAAIVAGLGAVASAKIPSS